MSKRIYLPPWLLKLLRVKLIEVPARVPAVIFGVNQQADISVQDT